MMPCGNPGMCVGREDGAEMGSVLRPGVGAVLQEGTGPKGGNQVLGFKPLSTLKKRLHFDHVLESRSFK